MKIKAFYQRDDLERGESPNLVIDQSVAEAWWGRDPFEEITVEGVSANLLMDPEGTTDGHNVMFDSTFMDGIRLDKNVPISPLFVRDLTGRPIYVGFGPERKGNAEWEAYRIEAGPDGVIPEDERNPFIPLCTFPRFCRDVEAMEGKDLLEHVFLTKFRCLEMGMGFNAQLSSLQDDEDQPELVAPTYLCANMYPYKLRLDTFYVDGFKLPQTQMVYARGANMGVNPTSARRMGEQMLAHWQARPAGTAYAAWLELLGGASFENLYQGGCTLIPTFEACNGYHVVSDTFDLEDYWPGRAVPGLHDIMEYRADKAPRGTILEVIDPGFVTATYVRPARVAVSDGSAYVSPHADNPVALIPNMYLPHQRTLDDWNATWLPTHPEHFEAPAIWGWDATTGRFLQLYGPLWDPLHYFYESVDLVLAEFERTPLPGRRGLVKVPADMEGRFFPIVPLAGFDTFSQTEYERRLTKGVLPQSCLKRIETNELMAGLGYHPLPAEYEFELDTFWFPELHPQNRGHGLMPMDLQTRVVPVIYPRVTMTMFISTVDAPEEAVWLTEEARMATPVEDAVANYTQLLRYLEEDLPIEDIMRLCPVPFLSDVGEKLKYPAPGWWRDQNDVQLDGPLALQDMAPNVHDALWDMRQDGVELVQLRHMIYGTSLPLYMLAWWSGWGLAQLRDAMENWIKTSDQALADADFSQETGETETDALG